jgi:hypothetical protein
MGKLMKKMDVANTLWDSVEGGRKGALFLPLLLIYYR